MATFVISSGEESDDVPIGSNPVGSASASASAADLLTLDTAPISATPPAEIDVDDDDEPDWVRSFTPTTQSPKKRRPSLAGRRQVVDDADSDDSFLNLLSDNDDDDEGSGTGSGAGSGKGGDSGSAGGSGDALDEGGGGKAKGKPKSPAKAIAGAAAGRMKNARSCMPLVCVPKFEEKLVLLQSESTALDLSGDVGAVGRVKVSVDCDEMWLDIKGTLYSCDSQLINTVCVVSVGEDEARVTAVFDEIVTLHEDNSTFGAGEKLVSGMLDEDGDGDGAEDEPEGDGKSGKTRNTKADKAAKAKVAKAGKAKTSKAKTSKPRKTTKPKPKKASAKS